MRDEYSFVESGPNRYVTGRIGAMKGKWDGFDYEGFQALDDVLAESLCQCPNGELEGGRGETCEHILRDTRHVGACEEEFLELSRAKTVAPNKP